MALVASVSFVRVQGQQSPVLAREQILVTSVQLLASPDHQVVPRNIATTVTTQLIAPAVPASGTNGFTSADLLQVIPPDALVFAELRGPAFGTPVALVARPNEPFKIQPLAVTGLYVLDNIRLVSGGTTILEGTPSSATIEVIDKVLVSQVSSRALSAQEIQKKGIFVDQDNFEVVNFTAAFGIVGNQKTIDFPVVLPKRSGGSVPATPPPPTLPPLQPAAAVPPFQQLPQLQEAFQTTNVSISGLLLKIEDEDIARQFTIPPIPGVIIIPGNIAYLHQFFSVLLMVSNVAPGNSNLVVRDITATIVLPTGADTVADTGDDPLKMARVGTPPVEQSKTQPVKQLGPDGRLGTEDDIPSLAPGQSGDGEYLVEGRKEGTHTVQMQITGTLDGLPVGPVKISGFATGVVEVRNPTFALTLSHPATVTAGEEYDLLVTVTNTSETIANLVSVSLLPNSISGAILKSDQSVQVDTIAARDSATVSFHLLSQQTGNVSATSFVSDDVPGKFELRTAVGALGIPLSPNTLVLPPAAKSLPADLRNAGIGLLGQAFALATSPVVPQGLLPITQQIVYERATNLAQAGQRLGMEDSLPRVAADLALDFTGNGFTRIAERLGADQASLVPQAQQDYRGFDELLRRSARGTAFLQLMAGIFAGEVRASGALEFQSAWAGADASRPPYISAITGLGGGAAPVVLSLTGPDGKRLGMTAADSAITRDLPYANFFSLIDEHPHFSQLGLVSVPTAGTYSVALAGTGTGTFDLGLVVPEGSQLRQVTYQGVAITPGAKATVTFTVGAANAYQLVIDRDGDGVADQTLDPAVSEIVPDAAPALVSAIQIVTGAPDLSQFGQLLGLLFSEEISAASSQTDADATSITHYQVDGNQVLGAALQPGGRVVLLSLRDGIGPFVPRTVTISGIEDRLGHPMGGTASLPIVTTISNQGGTVSGQVRRADGTAVRSARIQFSQRAPVAASTGELATDLSTEKEVTVTVKDADASGHYSFDYVRNFGTSGESIRFTAVDLDGGDRGEVLSQIRRPGQHLDLDIIFLGTGTLVGRTFASDGLTPLAGAVVKVSSITRIGEVFGAVADASGAFSIAGIPAGNFTVEAVHVLTNSRTLRAGAIPAAGATVVQNLTLIPLAEIIQKTGAIKGQVFRADGTTLAAGVPVFTDRGGLATTDQSGSYRIEGLPEGPITVKAIDQARLEQGQIATTVIGGTEAPANILLFGGTGSVHGIVIDAAGLRVANVIIGGGLALVRTAVNGEFQLDDVPLGQRSITALDEVRQRSSSATVNLVTPGEIANVQIILQGQGSVAGRVFEADGITPMKNLTVYLLGGGNPSTVTDTNGGYRFDRVPVGAYGVSAFRPDFSDGNIVDAKVVFQGEVRIANVVARGKGRVTGIVLAADGVTPLGARVGLSEMQVKTGVLKPPDNLTCQTEAQVGDITIEFPKCATVGIGFEQVPLTRVIDNDIASGTFAFNDVFVGPITVEAANGFSPTIMRAAATIANPGDTIAVTLRLQATSSVKGVVYQPDGVTPVGRDVVVTFNSSTLRDVKVVTNDQGNYLFPLVNPGGFDVTASDSVSGLVGLSQGTIDAGAAANVTIRLLGTGTATVAVRGSNGIIPGARVTLTRGTFPGEQRQGVTGLDGAVTFAGGDSVTEGPFSVSALDLITGITGFANGSVPGPGGHADVQVTLSDAAGTVLGRFLFADGLTPIPNAQVHLSSARGDAFNTTDTSGTFTFDGVFGEFSVEAFDPVTARRGRTTGRISLNHEDLTADVIAVAQGTVKGVVRSSKDSAPFAAADVTISVNSLFGGQLVTSSGIDGSFSFPGVSAGTFTLQARDPLTGIGGSASGSVAFEGEQVTADVILHVPSLGRVQGFVRRADSSPALGAQVTLGTGPRTSVDANGSYVFQDVPVGPVSVLATAPIGFDAGTGKGELKFDGDVATVDVQFLGTGNVTGTVRGAAGDVVPFARVSLTGRSAIQRSVSFDELADANGRLVFPGVLVGDVSVTAIEALTGLAGSASGKLAVDGATLDLTVLLQPAGAVHGRVVREDRTTPAVGMAVEVIDGSLRFGSTATDGTLSFQNLALGTYQIAITDPVGTGIAKASAVITQQGQIVDLGTLVLDEFPPRVVTIAPGPGASSVPVTQAIHVVFSEPVDPSSVNTTTLRVTTASGAVAGAWTLSADRATASFLPSFPYRDFTQVSVKITTAVTDLVGKALSVEAISSFVTADSTPPVTLSRSPAANARDIQSDSVIRIAYSETVDPARFTGAPISLAQNGTPVTGRTDFILGNTAIVFTPSAPLAINSTYQVSVPPAFDIFGNRQPQGSAYSFATIDTIAPPVDALTASGGTTVRVGATAIVKATVSAPDVALVDLLVNGAVVQTVRTAPFTFSIPVTTALAPSFLTAARATDLSGNVGQLQTLLFTVQPDQPPTIIITSPAEGSVVNSGAHATVTVRATDDVGVSHIGFQTVGALNGTTSLTVTPPVQARDATFQVDVPADAVGGSRIDLKVAAVDTLGQSSATATVSVVVVDVTPPTVRIASPAAGVLVDAGQTLAVAVTGADASGVASIALQATGAVSFSETRTISPAQPTSQATFQVPVPSTARASDHVTFTAAAIDAFGNAAAPVSLTVGIRDVVAPAATLIVNGGLTQVQPGRTMSLSVSATDDGGVTTVGYEASGAFTLSGSQTVSPPQTSASGQFSVTVPATASVGSPLTLVGTAADSAGNVGRSAGVVLSVVADERPTVQVTSPATGASAIEGSPLTISANASDDVGVVRVEFRLNGTPVATFPSPPYVVQTVVPAGADLSQIIIEAIATDTAGQTARDSVALTLRTDTTSPRLLTITPADQSVGVSIATPVQVTFSELIDPARVTPDSFRVSVAGSTVPGGFSFLDGNATARFAPSQLLPLDSTVLVELTAAITDRFGNALVDAAGNPLTQPLTFTFATGVFAISNPPPNSDVVEKSRLVLEAHGSSSLGIARVVFTVNGVDLPTTGGPTFTAMFDVPAASTTPTLTIVATARDGAGGQIATAQNVVNVTVGLQASPPIVGGPLGGSTSVRLTLSSALAEDLSVSFEAVDPAVVTLPSAPVILRAGQTTATATIGGATVGNTTVLAHSSHGTASVIASVSIPEAQQTLTPIAPPVAVAIAAPPSVGQIFTSISARKTLAIRLLSTPAAVDTPVVVTTSNSAVATVEGQAIVRAGQQVATITIVTGSAGTATLVFKAGVEARELTVVVGASADTPVPAVLAAPVGVAVAAPPSVGQLFTSTSARQTLTIRVLSTPAAADTPVVVTSSNSAVATVEGQPIVRAGQQVATVTIVTGAAGTATLVFKAGAEARELTVIVGASPDTPVPAVLAAPVGVAIAAPPSVGQIFTSPSARQTLTIRVLSTPAAADTPVLVTSSNGAVVTVEGQPIVRAGQQVATITIVTGEAGTATLVFRAGAEARELTIAVGASPNTPVPAVLAAPVGIAVAPAPLTGVVISPIGAVSIVGVRLLSAPATSDVVVTVTSSDTNVALVQGVVVVHTGEQVVQIGIVTTTQGVATLTFKTGDQTVSFTVITGTPPAGSVPIIVAPIVGVQIQ